MSQSGPSGQKIIGQAATCKYVTECPQCSHKVDYLKSIVRNILTRGVADTEIQRDILGIKIKTEPLKKFWHLLRPRSLGRIQLRSWSNQRVLVQLAAPTDEKNTKWLLHASTVAIRAMGKNLPPQTRRKECPAYGHRCKNCEKENHFERVCRSKEKMKPKPRESAGTDEGMGAMFNGLCGINQPISLGHHLYNHLNNRWTQRSSLPHPYIKVKIEALPQRLQRSWA